MKSSGLYLNGHYCRTTANAFDFGRSLSNTKVMPSHTISLVTLVQRPRHSLFRTVALANNSLKVMHVLGSRSFHDRFVLCLKTRTECD